MQVISGTVQNTVKLDSLKSVLEQNRRMTGLLKEKKSHLDMSPEQRMLEQFKEQMANDREQNKNNSIATKVMNGETLTPDEEQYLTIKNPGLLNSYRHMKEEQKAEEEEFRRCKTKDEVERVKMNRMGNFAAEAKKISNDPYIPLDKKLEHMNQLNNEVCLVNEAHQEFVKSNQYRDMPTDEELSKERIEEASEEQDKMQKEVMDSISDVVEGTVENDIILEVNGKIDENPVINVEDTPEKIGESAEQKAERAKREKTTEIDIDESAKSDISFEKISDSIRSFVISLGSQNSKIDISL